MRKLTTRAFRREIVRFRALNAQRLYEAIDFIAQAESEQKDRDQQRRLQRDVAKGLKPFREIPGIAEWMSAFDVERRTGHETRFKFLVLVGPSRFGKTQLAKSLFGVDRTLVLNCQNVDEPNLRPFERRDHRAIVFDEISPLTVVKNKVLSQAGIEGVECGQSRTSIYSYWRFLYAIPLIISTNEWVDNFRQDQLEEHAKAVDWLLKNQALVVVDRPVWQE